MTDRRRSQTILRQILETIGAYGSQEFISFFGVVLYAKLVTTAVLGQYFLFVSVVNVTAFLGVIGVNTHIEREIGRNQDNHALLAATVTIVGGFIAILIVVATVAQPLVGRYFETQVVPLLIIAVAIRAAANIYGAVLRGEKRAPLAQTLASFERFVMFGLGVGLLTGGLFLGPFYALSVAYVASMGIHFVAALWFATVYPRGIPSFSMVRSLLSTTKFISVSQIYSQGQQWADTLILGYFLGPTPVAIYEIAWRVSAASGLVFNTIYTVLFPRLSQWVSEGDSEALGQYASNFYYYSMVPVYALFAGGVATGDALLRLVYSATYVAGWAPLVLILFGRLFHTLERTSSTLLFAIDKERAVARISVVGLVANIVLNVLLIPLIGILGAAVATSSAFVIGGSLKRVLVGRYILIDPLFRANMIAIFGATVMAIVLVLSRRYLLAITSLLDLAVFITGGALLYGGILTALDPNLRQQLLTLPAQLK